MSAPKRSDNRDVALVLQNTLGTNVLYPTGIALADSTPMHVAIVDGTGDQITSFGGGIQYTDAAAAATHPIGTGIIFNNAGTYNFVSAAQPLPINVTSVIGAAVPANAFYMGMISAGGNLQGLTAANNVGDGGSLTAGLAVGNYNFDGSNWNRVRSGGVTGMAGISGDTASAASDAGNPVKVGGRAQNAEITAVTNGQRVNAAYDLVGKQIVLPYANPENFVSGRATATDTTSTSLISAPASGLRNYITQITLWNASATSTYIKIQDGSGGTELYDIPAPAGGGATLSFPTPLRQPTTATAIFFAANAAANAVFVSASGYKGV